MFGIIDAVIVRPLVNFMFIIYNLVGDFGLAIILFTVLVKIISWPLMKRQLHQTRVMRDIQPELAKIKKNCKGNKQLESLQMMDLYKRKNIKPFRSMLMLFIQFPIFIALFTAINVSVRPRLDYTDHNKDYTVAHSAYAFTEKLPRIHEIIEHQDKYFADLEAFKQEHAEDEKAETPVPDVVYDFKPRLFNTLDLSARALDVVNRAGVFSADSAVILVFSLVSAATQLILSRQQDPSRKKGKKRKTMKQLMAEAADGKEPSQEELNAVAQSQMTFMMPVMMLFIMLSLPGAVVLYYLLNNLITIVQQKVILERNYDEMEITAEKDVLKELKNAKEAIIVKDRTIDANTAEINRLTKKASAIEAETVTRIKVKPQKTHFTTRKNKKDKTHITRISADHKKKRR